MALSLWVEILAVSRVPCFLRVDPIVSSPGSTEGAIADYSADVTNTFTTSHIWG